MSTSLSTVRTTTLSRTPSLLPMYAKAAVSAQRHHGGSLPESRYELHDQAIDLDHLAGYERVCGFRTSDLLPGTYLHVLAFPIAVAVLTEPGFPFPLVGLVHVANTITVHRPVRADELVSFTACADGLRPHPAGRQVDIHVAASVAGQLVWDECSTYLRRGGGTGVRREHAELAPPSGPVGFVRVPGDIGRRYAAVSGDRNPMHLHPLPARALGFPAAIAHGMWLAARTLATLEGRLSDAYTLQIGFKTPLFMPSTVAIATDRTATGWTLDVRGAKSGKPHLAGTITPPTAR